MPATSPVFLNRPDTFFGVCEAIGQDVGINANVIRIAFGAFVLINPLAVLVAYAALGAIVAVSRIAVPVSVAKPAPSKAAKLPDAVNDADDMLLAQVA